MLNTSKKREEYLYMSYYKISTKSLTSSRYTRLLCRNASIFILFFVFFYANLSYFKPMLFYKNDVILGADTNDTVWSIKKVTIGGDMKKHLVYAVVVGSIHHTIKLMTPLDDDDAVVVALALLAAINILLANLVFELFVSKGNPSILFTVCYAFLFSNLVFFSIPETYVLSSIAIIVWFYFFTKLDNNVGFRDIIWLAVVIAAAGLCNPPLLSLSIPTCYLLYEQHKNDLKRFSLLATGILLIPLSLFTFSYTVAHGRYFYVYFEKYSATWASFSHFLNIQHATKVFLSFFFYSIISPVRRSSFAMFRSSSNIPCFLAYFDSITGTLLLFIYCSLLFYSIYYVIKKKNHIIISLWLWISLMLLFYIYFNPQEAMLYSCQIMFPLAVIFTIAFNEMKFKYKRFVFYIFLLLLIINNMFSLYNTPQKLDHLLWF